MTQLAAFRDLCWVCQQPATRYYPGGSMLHWPACSRHRQSVAMRASWDRRHVGLPGQLDQHLKLLGINRTP